MKRFNRKFLRRLIYPSWFYFLSKKLSPISKKYGMNRGTPLDRYYISKFLEEHKEDIHGICLEIRDSRYGQEYASQINRLDILDIDTNNKEANIFDDLRLLTNILENTYDCIILTQILQYIDNLESAIKECHRILKPNGVLLITVPSISRLDPKATEYWRFAPESLSFLLSPVFGKENLEIKTYGNVLAGLGFWVGQATEEFSQKKLDHYDPMFPVLVTAKAKK